MFFSSSSLCDFYVLLPHPVKLITCLVICLALTMIRETAFDLSVSISLNVASKETTHSIFKSLLRSLPSSDDIVHQLIAYGSHATNIPPFLKLSLSHSHSLETSLEILGFCIRQFRFYKNWSVFVEIVDSILADLNCSGSSQDFEKAVHFYLFYNLFLRF